jgi:hypothetical protein
MIQEVLALSWSTIFWWCLKAFSAAALASAVVMLPLVVVLGWIESKQ